MTTLFQSRIVAEQYARHRGSFDEDFIDELSDLLRLCPGPVLDIGAGAGAPARALTTRGHEVVAVEPSRAMISQARNLNPKVPFVQARGESLPLRTGSAGSAAVLYVLHHADDPVALLSEARRVVVPSGRILVVSGKPDSSRQRFFAKYFPTLAPDLPGPVEIGDWAAEAGLYVAESRTSVHWVYPNRHLDEDYMRMVTCDMFSTLRMLNEREYECGVRRLREDLGRPLPAPEVTLLVLERP
ncbi:MAG TPA: class I SAM-dependent methyltransferase [Actinomycetota bacterium]|nr:class I SAM-dependent methyltransferase [Actinomycetota bacterium]